MWRIMCSRHGLRCDRLNVGLGEVKLKRVSWHHYRFSRRDLAVWCETIAQKLRDLLLPRKICSNCAHTLKPAHSLRPSCLSVRPFRTSTHELKAPHPVSNAPPQRRPATAPHTQVMAQCALGRAGTCSSAGCSPGRSTASQRAPCPRRTRRAVARPA